MSGDYIAAKKVEYSYRTSDESEIEFNYPSNELEYLEYLEISGWMEDCSHLVSKVGGYDLDFESKREQEMLGVGISFPRIDLLLIKDLQAFYREKEQLLEKEFQIQTNTSNKTENLINQVKYVTNSFIEYQLWEKMIQYKQIELIYTFDYLQEDYSEFITRLATSPQFVQCIIDYSALLEDMGELYIDSLTNKQIENNASLYKILNTIEDDIEDNSYLFQEFEEQASLGSEDAIQKLQSFRKLICNKYAHSIDERKELDHSKMIDILTDVLFVYNLIEISFSVRFYVEAQDKLFQSMF